MRESPHARLKSFAIPSKVLISCVTSALVLVESSNVPGVAGIADDLVNFCSNRPFDWTALAESVGSLRALSHSLCLDKLRDAHIDLVALSERLAGLEPLPQQSFLNRKRNC
eukprot:TRINITY_DN91915_c0_g1_i1.p2 TRINITY_DN91915_c0_g1~~TRINITY_DN91915_c0_g1_i1.p2  ORF type:complete len:111 (-),score=15.03 TRINITY_DN91915_c0_g1_i1:218-550(-)